MRLSGISPEAFVRRDLSRLESIYRTAHQSYRGLKVSCESRVVRWVWAVGSVYQLDPLFFYDSHLRIGQLLSSKPVSSEGTVVYGFDNDGRLILRREYSEFPGLYYEGFYEYYPDRIVGQLFHYDTASPVINCEQLVVGDCGPAYFQRYGIRGWSSYSYSCVNNRIEAFSATSKETEEPERRFSGKLVYGQDSVLELWTKESGPRQATMTFRGREIAGNPFVRSLRGQNPTTTS